uniref:Homoserine O-succinyltransferase n=1 Tax=Candidatus Kentrum sp. MB TaxID=2138164 RepID=A0A450XSW1_9GAMM|nr:MAG: homoserine O-acetyltransferase [Candidatus Kentron sp. MB]VFK32338.1 MAG: homoserine O-acetyltransferase [Candidatus Kentron sp. MB]VFK75836.1 MAG: homoserine O-acetyltransferase [Candidatus Kentron sp. MB]
MPAIIPPDSVGLVTPQTRYFDTPLPLDCGDTLDEYDLVYETYGELNATRSNAVLICHALSSDHHAAGYHHMDDRKPGWWDVCIGPGKPIDTRRFFVVCPNNLGGCKGSTGPNTVKPEEESTGPSAVDPKTGLRYGLDFPIVTVKDWVRSQERLGQALGIERWAAVVGGSLGGMQALQWAIDFPDRVANTVIIAAAPRLSAQNIAFNEVARQAILSDPDFHGGRYYDHGKLPHRGLRVARMLGHITYLSEDAMRAKFGRQLRGDGFNFDFDDPEFEVGGYLQHQGEAFVEQFDANTYLLMTKALDYFDPSVDYGDDFVAALSRITARCFVLSFTSDWRFSSARSKEIVRAMIRARVNVSYAEVVEKNGHDAFLMPIPYYLEVLGAFMGRIEGNGAE